MKINSHIIFLIAIVGIITAGVVGATLLNNGSMKQTDFDGIKVNVPSDSNLMVMLILNMVLPSIHLRIIIQWLTF